MLQKPIFLALLVIVVFGAVAFYLKSRNNQVPDKDSGKAASKADPTPEINDIKKSPNVLESPGIVSAESRQQVLSFLAEGKLADALHVLAGYQPDKVKTIQEELDALMKKKNMGVIAFEQWFLEHNRLAFAAWEMLPRSKNAPASVSSDHFQDLLDKGALEEVLDVLIEAGYEEMALTKGQLAIIKGEEERNTITEAIAKMNKARIKYTISERL